MVMEDSIILITALWKLFPILPMSIRAVLRSHVSFKDKVGALAGLLSNFANYLRLKERYEKSDKIILWDEFLLQRFLSVFVYSTQEPPMKIVEKYLKWM